MGSESKWCHLDAPALDRLDHASLIVQRAFDAGVYLVGSCLERPDYRDVDVRVILDDAEYNRLFPPGGGTRRTDPLWSLLCLAITEYLVRLTGLHVDFQVQSRSHANNRYSNGQRVPLGMYPTRGGSDGE